MHELPPKGRPTTKLCPSPLFRSCSQPGAAGQINHPPSAQLAPIALPSAFWSSPDLQFRTMDALEASNWTVAGCLAAPHLLYAYIWFFPRSWQAIFKKRSVEAFETVAWLLKSE